MFFFFIFFIIKVEAYTEEIDSSAIRIRENKGLVSQLKEISEKEEEDNVTLQEFKDKLQDETNASRSKVRLPSYNTFNLNAD